MPELPSRLGDRDIIVLDVMEDESELLQVKCALCEHWGHRVAVDGTLVCAYCDMTIPAHETVQRPSIMRVNLPRTWQVSDSR